MLFSCLPAGAHSTTAVRRKAKAGARRSFTVDIHCHLETPEAAELARPHFQPAFEPNLTFVNAESAEVNRKQQETVHPQLTSVERRLKDMDKMGIDIQAVSPAPNQYYYWASPELGRETARLVNDRIAEVMHAHPDRFVGLGTVPLQAPELAVAELERAVKELGLRGAKNDHHS